MPEVKEKTSILFVCMGNICRSPTAEGVFRHFVNEAGLEKRIRIDSAGTHAYHSGEPPDTRAHAAAQGRGYSLDGILARRVSDADFDDFDYILVMDDENLEALRSRAPAGHRAELSLFLSFSGGRTREVPDPYYGGAAGFERVLDLVEEASRALLERLSG